MSGPNLQIKIAQIGEPDLAGLRNTVVHTEEFDCKTGQPKKDGLCYQVAVSSQKDQVITFQKNLKDGKYRISKITRDAKLYNNIFSRGNGILKQFREVITPYVASIHQKLGKNVEAEIMTTDIYCKQTASVLYCTYNRSDIQPLPIQIAIAGGLGVVALPTLK